MVTNSEAQYPITHWLQWLKEEYHYVPSSIMIDNSDTEIVAINKAYNVNVGDDTSDTYLNTKILICHWHILKCWKKNILAKVVAAPSDPRKTIEEKSNKREEALSLMKAMMQARSPTDFDIAQEEFELWCIDNDDEWDSSALYDYYEQKYLRKNDKWSQAWRRVRDKQICFKLLSNDHTLGQLLYQHQ